MPTTEFEAPLDEEALEWVRYRFTTEGGTVTAFTVQYETTLDGRRLPVVRFDMAHGFCHRDILDRRGHNVSKQRLSDDPSLGEALQRGAADIRNNWRRYREAFLRGPR